MAKQAQKAAPPRGQQVARNDSAAGLPAHLQGYKSEGRGVPTDASDFLIPMAMVLDPKSPQVEKRGANYIKGAEPGDIYIKNGPIQIIKGEEGFLFQCCYRDEAVIEWLPRNRGGGGGVGFVARHPKDYIKRGENVEQRSHPEDKAKLIWVNATSGNPLVDTAYYGGFAIFDEQPPLPLVLPFASTGWTVAKGWNMLMAQKRIGNDPADIWLCYYRIATRLRQRGEQAWYLFDITDAGELAENNIPKPMWCPTPGDVERGRLLHESLSSGIKQMAEGNPEKIPY